MSRLIFSAMFLLFTTTANAADATDIMHRSQTVAYAQGNDFQALVQLDILKRNGNSKVKEFKLWRKNILKSQDQDYFLHFLRPTGDKGLTLLVHKHTASEDDIHLYLPAARMTSRIAGNDKRNRFAGSDLVYEDIYGRNPDLDAHVLARESDSEWVIDSTPKNSKGLDFARYRTAISKSNLLPLRVEYFRTDGTLSRNLEIQQTAMIDGYATIMQMKITDSATGGSTTVKFSQAKYDQSIDAAIFTERSLANPPK